jgi:hypothetical protein
MVEAKDNEVYEEDLVDYEEEVENVADGAPTNGSADVVKKYVLRGRFCLLGFVVGKSDLTYWGLRVVCTGGTWGSTARGSETSCSSRSFSVPSRTADLNILPKASFISLLLLLIIALSVILALDAAELNI